MLWVMVVLTVGMGVVQEMCTRMGAVTGKGLSDLIRENFPLRLTVFILFIFLLANGGVIVSEFIGIAAALNLFGIPSWIGAPCGGVLIWLLVARGSYRHAAPLDAPSHPEHSFPQRLDPDTMSSFILCEQERKRERHEHWGTCAPDWREYSLIALLRNEAVVILSERGEWVSHL